jgi:hypothetical protein
MNRTLLRCNALGATCASLAILFSGAAVAAPPAVTPILSGTYIAQIMHFCQASIANNTGPNSTGVYPTNSGDSNYNLFTISFDSNAGQATVSGRSIDGSPLIVEGYPFTVLADNSSQQTLPYSNTNTTFTIYPAANTTFTYHALFAKVDKKTGIPETVIFGGLENPGCAISGILVQQ